MIYARGDTATGFAPLAARFNGDTAANYDYQFLQGLGAGVSSSESFAQTSARICQMPDSTAGANLFNAACVFIPNYAGATNNKLCLSISSEKHGTSASNMFVHLFGGFWRSSAAINRVTILPASGNLVAGTRVTLYGMGA